ncbi:MAG: flagellar biosynthesis anti-sigma factor FlgM [Phycisphaerae bacterium]
MAACVGGFTHTATQPGAVFGRRRSVDGTVKQRVMAVIQMNPISNVNGTSASVPITQTPDTRTRGPGRIEYGHPADEVEISDMGAMLSKLRELPDVRMQKIAGLRAEIEAGTFMTQERIDGTVDRLMEEMG